MTKISISRCLINDGQKMWRVRWHEMGKVRRKFFTAKDAAQAFAGRLRGDQIGIDDFWSGLSQSDREKMFSVWREAERRNLDLMALVTRPDAAATVASPSCSLVRREMVDAKETSGLSSDYVSSLSQIVKAFIKGRESVPMASVSFADVVTFMDAQNLRSKPTVRARLSTWFKFGLRRGYCPANLCERLDAVKVPKAPVRIFTPEEVETALAWFRKQPRAFGWFVLSTFCGLRPEEAQKTRWAMVDFNEGWVRVEAQTSKVSQRRVVYPLPRALELLKEAKRLKSELPLTSKQLQMERNGFRLELGLEEWPHDVTRHTAASMWLALTGDAAAVAHALGHSERILHRNYKALVTRAEAERFWALRP